MSRSRHIDRLAQRADESQRRIADLIERSAQKINGYNVWGQFLDAPRRTNQYGLYGTSAAVQILAASGHTATSPLIGKALAVIPGLASSTQGSLLYDETDLALTFKEAAILAACQPSERYFAYTEPVEKMLIDQLIDGRGWGNYCKGSDQDDTPRLLPTAHALFALRRSRQFRISEKCEAVLKWFSETLIGSIQEIKTHEACMALLVLAEYEPEGNKISSCKRARESLKNKICNWMKQLKGGAIGETASYHYYVLNEGIQHNHYMYYPSDLLAALALLSAGNPKASRAKVNWVVKVLCDAISAEGGYRSKVSNRLATVDQMWAFFLLFTFNKIFDDKPREIISPISYTLYATRTRSSLMTAGTLILGTAGVAISTLSWLDLAFRVLGATIGAVALSVLASAIFAWVRGE